MISMIVACAHNNVIGKDGKVPWHLSADLKYFKRVTTGHTIVMGYKTFISIGRALPQRRNIVLTHKLSIDQPGVEIAHNSSDILALPEEVFIIGGEVVYKQFMDDADRLYITEIDLNTPGDTFFPAWDHDAFTLLSSQEGIVDAKNPYPHTFYVYERRAHLS